MKKILFIFAGILISNNLFSQVQFTKDTIYLEGNGVGYVSDLVSEERTITSQTGKDLTGQVITYSITLFRPITDNERASIRSRYNPNSTPYIEVRFLEEFVFSNNQAKAGYLIYQAGELKTQRNNLYLTSALVSSLGSIIQWQDGINQTQRKNIAYATISLGTILTVTAIVKDYKANAKLKEAGITLQK